MIKPRNLKFPPPQGKFKRHSGRRSMTVCIGAVCSEGDDPRIVLCRDWRGEVPEVGSTDWVMKRRHLSKDWVALLAGNTARAEELCLRYEYYLRDHTLNEKNLTVECRRVFHGYKRELADSYLKTTYGFPFDYLVGSGKEKLGEQFTATCLDQISRLRVDAELIVAGFALVSDYIDETTTLNPMLCAISENHDGDVVVSEEDFAVIGSGCNAARTMLYYREQENNMSLMETIYTVAEAKAMTRTVPGIGSSFSVDVMYPDRPMTSLTPAGFARCSQLFDRFGPRTIYGIKNRDKWFEFKSEYLESLKSSDPELPPKAASQSPSG